jgi:alpha-D-ribose 1-methylphosphonate 5-triphosphate synthase subunit PhnH
MMTTHIPAYTQAEAAQHATFTALMGALSFPGRAYDLPAGDAFDLIADALLDLETSAYTPVGKLAERLALTGARLLSPDVAAYHFYPSGSLDLATVAQAHTGDMLYPDTAATLVIGCDFHLGDEPTHIWTGAGIQGAHHTALTLPDEFWGIRARAAYPLGWDVFLTDGRRVVGLPRTTRVAEASAALER